MIRTMKRTVENARRVATVFALPLVVAKLVPLVGRVRARSSGFVNTTRQNRLTNVQV